MITTPDPTGRTDEYCRRQGLVPVRRLGFGVHGSVFAAQSRINGKTTAIKSFEGERFYLRERNVYLRLKEFSVTHVRNAAVPELVGFDNELWIIEMTIVTRPFVLDFAGAYLDLPPDYSDEVLADWETEKKEQFGARWPEVRSILNELESYGVFMSDVNPGNISFEV
jgi:hypothetical protein